MRLQSQSPPQLCAVGPGTGPSPHGTFSAACPIGNQWTGAESTFSLHLMKSYPKVENEVEWVELHAGVVMVVEDKYEEGIAVGQ